MTFKEFLKELVEGQEDAEINKQNQVINSFQRSWKVLKIENVSLTLS